MIPKTIHYCWFGGKEKPETVTRMISKWHEVMPDYNIIEWNEENFDTCYCDFTREAYAFGNYAFVADVCRLHVLYEHGGIYLDTDIEVLRPFDPFLSNKSFCGLEDKWIGTGVIGAEPHCKWIGQFLTFYMKRHFINSWGHTVRTANTKLLTLKLMPSIEEKDKPTIYPIDYFCAKSWRTGLVEVTDNTVCIHHYACSWARKRKTLVEKLHMLKKGLTVRYFHHCQATDCDRRNRLTVSLVISTYNRPDALRVCLDSVLKQRLMPDEIVIGDDGSREDTKHVIDEMRDKSPVPIIHVWHEDKGFRLAMMRNKSIAQASGQYIIELDGDVFLHPYFVKDHLQRARRGFYLKGGRTNLGRSLTQEICGRGAAETIHPWTQGIENKPENSMRLPWLSRLIAPYYRKNRSFALGCNMSFFRDDYIRVNGYDEYFEGWGAEDGDFGMRLNMLGLRKLSLKFTGIVYHLWHEDKYMYNKEQNKQYSRECQQRGLAYCVNGVDKYLSRYSK